MYPFKNNSYFRIIHLHAAYWKSTVGLEEINHACLTFRLKYLPSVYVFLALCSPPNFPARGIFSFKCVTFRLFLLCRVSNRKILLIRAMNRYKVTLQQQYLTHGEALLSARDDGWKKLPHCNHFTIKNAKTFFFINCNCPQCVLTFIFLLIHYMKPFLCFKLHQWNRISSLLYRPGTAF